MKKRMLFSFVLLCLFGVSGLAEPKQPTHTDIRYSEEYDRSSLDFWIAKSKKPTPLVVNFHGGGFRVGDKRSFQRNSMLQNNLPKGVSFASVNYPYIDQMEGNYRKLLEHCAKSIRFIQKNASKYNIDKNRISVMGNSAGALITCFLGHAQNLGIRSIYPIQQPKGTPLILPHIHAGGPPILVYNRSGLNDQIHHPRFAIMLQKKCIELGIECIAYGVEGSGLRTLPKGKDVNDLAMQFFKKSWKSKKNE